MRKGLLGIVGFVTLTVFTASFTVAQDSALRAAAGDKWVITAKAGGVNFVHGSVSIDRLTGKDGILIKGDSIQVGDRVSTGANGRAEILLNPGSYLRVGENSSFEFKTTSLEDLQVTVLQGSVILEVFAANDFRVAVSTSKDNFDLLETGVYRIDAIADGRGRIEVWKGKAEVGDETLKGGRTATTLDGQTAIAKFDRDERDGFEQWSRDRSKELAKATDSLKDRTLRTSLMRSFLGGRWNMYDSFGLWVYDARFGRYCFLPFGFGWSSPYGFGYGTNIWWYQLPPTVYYPPNRTPVAGNPPAAGTPPVGTPPRDRRPINGAKRDPNVRAEQVAPPYVKMQGSGRGTGPDGVFVGPTRSGGLGGFGADRSGNGGFSPAPSVDVSPRLPAPVAPSNPPSRGGSKSPIN